MTNTQNYSLLRPFDLEAAKIGDEFVFISPDTSEAMPRKLVAERNGLLVVDYGDTFQITNIEFATREYRMAPLAWVEGKPVYKGDVLYRKDFKMKQVTAAYVFHNGNDYLQFEEGGNARLRDGGASLTWNPPKVKREGWVNVYQHNNVFLRPTKEDADLCAKPDRIACVRIEWEE